MRLVPVAVSTSPSPANVPPVIATVADAMPAPNEKRCTAVVNGVPPTTNIWVPSDTVPCPALATAVGIGGPDVQWSVTGS